MVIMYKYYKLRQVFIVIVSTLIHRTEIAIDKSTPDNNTSVCEQISILLDQTMTLETFKAYVVSLKCHKPE